MQGKIIKGIAGFYTVYGENGKPYECKARGNFRKSGIKPYVGDDVVIQILDEQELLGNVEEILPRKNALVRPAVANVDQAMIVCHGEPYAEPESFGPVSRYDGVAGAANRNLF